MKTEGGGRGAGSRRGGPADGRPGTEEEEERPMKLKSKKTCRQFEGGSAPSGRDGLAAVIADGGSADFQGKSEKTCELETPVASGGRCG